MDRRTFLALLALPAVASVLPACGDDDDPGNGPPGAARSDVPRTAADPAAAAPAATAVNAFGTELYRRLAGAQPTGNIVCSPTSIALALTMASAGARGTTLEEMQATLEISDPATIHRAMNALDAELDRRNGKDVTLAVANSIWGQEGFAFETPFLDLLAAEYGAGLELVDYIDDTDGAREAINDWVDDRTEGRIPQLLDEGVLTPDSRLTLVNAIYMKATWIDRFSEDATVDRPFTTADAEVIDVPTMALTGTLAYSNGDGWQAVELPYEGNELAMVILLPEEGYLAEYQQHFVLSESVDYFEHREVALRLPRFDIRAALSLGDHLAAMGMELAFSPEADFSGITTETALSISAVIHQANITVDEEGTEAAAATAVVIGATSAPIETEIVEMFVDRPFLFVVRDRDTGVILFLGRVGDPRS